MRKFIQAGVIVCVSVVLTILVVRNLKRDKDMTLRVAFPYDKPLSVYEPTRIHYAPEYILLENIYSPLIELHPENGEPVPGIADRFEWVGNELHFHVRDNLKTADGNSITALDVEFSLKRLLIKRGNTHGNFHDLMCTDLELKSIEDSCSGIRVEGNTLILAPAEKKEFLLPMMAALDFAVIPKSSVDPVTLDIKDYKNTSGPYFVKSDDGKGNIVLASNKTHYHYKEDIPQEIVIVPSGIEGYENSLDQFKTGKVDYITTIDKLPAEKVIEFSKENKGNLHTTMNIRTYALTFTDKGLKKFSEQERIAIGKMFKRVWREHHQKSPGFSSTDQFFLPFGDGGLNEKTEEVLKELFSKSEELLNKKVSVSTIRVGDISPIQKLFEKYYPNVSVYEGKTAPSFMKNPKDSEIPDAFISGPDTGFLEDIGLISYSINAGYFGAEKEEMRAWLKEYMEIPEKDNRISKLKELHLKVLKEGILIPLVNSPYAAFARDGWKLGISQIYANNPLWPIVRD